MSKMMDIYNAVRGNEDTFVYEYGGEPVEIHVKKFISPNEKIGIANEVFKLCFVYDENGKLNIRSAFINPIKRLFFINMYCKDFSINLKEDGEACFDFVMNTDFFDKLVNVVGNDEYYEYSCSIDDYIDFLVEEHRAEIASSKLDNAISDFLNKVNALLPDDINSAEYAELVKKVVNMPDDKSIVKQILEYHGDADGRQNTENG